MTILYMYIICGVLFGCFTTYKIVEAEGWNELYFDFVSDTGLNITEGQFRILFCLLVISVCTVIWLPIYVYAFSQRFK